jgi:CheY-like chemotaxis protein
VYAVHTVLSLACAGVAEAVTMDRVMVVADQSDARCFLSSSLSNNDYDVLAVAHGSQTIDQMTTWQAVKGGGRCE